MKMIAGAGCLRLLEQIPHPRGAHPYEHLHELRGRDREERDLRLAGKRPCQQRLARPGRPGEQHAAGDPAAEPAVLVRIAEEVDDLGQLLLGLVDSGHVVEIHVLV